MGAKVSTSSSMFLDIIENKNTYALIMPNTNFILRSEPNKVVLSIKKPNGIHIDGLDKIKSLKGTVLTITNDPYTENASHSISLGYWCYRLIIRDCEFKIEDDLFIFTGKTFNMKHQRPDR